MAIFGNATVYNFTNGSVIVAVIGTRTDVYLNYIWGVLILVPFIISTLLNPVVFIFKYNQPRSVPSLLYMILSASDFLTNLCQPIILSYEFLRPGLDGYISGCSTTRLLRTFNLRLFSELASTTTACLAIMRFIAIQFPFYRPRKRLVCGAIVAWTLIICVLPWMIFILWVSYNQGNNDNFALWWRPSQSLVIGEKEKRMLKSEFLRCMITTIIALVASGLTVIAMLWNKNTPNARSRNQGCITIVVMNAALIMTMVLYIIIAVPLLYKPYYIYTLLPDTSNFLALFVLFNRQVFLSAFNPLIIVLFSSQIKEFIRTKLGLTRVTPNVTVEMVETT